MSRRKLLIYSVSAGVILCALILFSRKITLPLHARGSLQGASAAANAVGYLLALPGQVLAGSHRALRSAQPSLEAPALLVDFALYTLGTFGALGLATGAFRRRRVGSADAHAPRTARRSFLAGALITAGAGVGLAAYSVFVEPRRVEVTHRAITIRQLPASLDGLRLVQLTDLHLGPWISLQYLRSVVRETSAQEPDVVLLTGDYVHASPAYIEPAATVLQDLAPRIGTVAVLGNHDWWQGADATRKAFRRRGIPLIDNDRRVVTPARRLVRSAPEGLCLAGLGDLWEDRCLPEKALGSVPPSMPRILLSHNPDAAEARAIVRGPWRIDLMVCGHTHGGQVAIPFAGTPVVPSRYGSKYAAGLVAGPACPVFISRGIGVTVLPVRFGVRPEIAVLDLRSA